MSLEVGAIVEGEVTGITNFGAFSIRKCTTLPPFPQEKHLQMPRAGDT